MYNNSKLSDSNTSEFIKYLANRLANYFKNKQDGQAGDAYYIQFDDYKTINRIYHEMKETPNAIGELHYKKIENGDVISEYSTYLLPYGEEKEIIIASSEETTDDYLVTLRGLVRGQTVIEFQDKAILFLIQNYDLDSITKSCTNLLDVGMPLNPSEMKLGITAELEKSSLNPIQKKIIEHDIKKKTIEIEGSCRDRDISLFEFADEFALIQKGLITENDYVTLGLFPDEELMKGKVNVASIEKRLEENEKLFNKVLCAHDADAGNELIKSFGEDLGKKLSNPDVWHKIDYQKVYSAANYNKNKKAVKIDSIDVDTNAGNIASIINKDKDGNVLIFNPHHDKKIKIFIKYNQEVDLSKLAVIPKEVCISKPKLSSDGRITINLDSVSLQQYVQVVYTDDRLCQNSKTTKINVCILPVAHDEFIGDGGKLLSNNFEIKAKNKKILFEISAEHELVIGPHPPEQQDSQIREIYDIGNKGYRIPIALLEFENDKPPILHLIKDQENIELILKLHEQKVTPSGIETIEEQKYHYRANFEIDGNEIGIPGIKDINHYFGADNDKRLSKYDIDILGDRLNLEKRIVENKVLTGTLIDRNLISIPQLSVPSRIKNAYLDILSYFEKKGTCPLLSLVDDELIKLYKAFIQECNTEIETLRHAAKSSMDEIEKTILLLGALRQDNKVFLSSFNIINVVYRLAFTKAIGDAEITPAMLKILDASALVPYIYFPSVGSQSWSLFQCENKRYNGFWLSYVSVNEDNNTQNIMNNKHLESIILSKMKNFVNYYSLLFSVPESPLLINAIHLGKSLEFLKAIFLFIEEKGRKNRYLSPVPIVIKFYEKDLGKFTQPYPIDEFFKMENIETVKADYSNIFPKGIDSIDARSILYLLKKSVSYYVLNDNGEYDYAHLTFCNDTCMENYTSNKMKDFPTGMSLGGVVNTLSSSENEKTYSRGFGSKDIDESSLLNMTAINLNEYANNLKDNGGGSAYQSGVSTYSNSISSVSPENVKSMYNNSLWVTFINPKHDLTHYLKAKNLLIVHYSDQLGSGNAYAAITVTEKIQLYERLMKQHLNNFLKKDNSSYAATDVDQIIKQYTGINGEWILQLASHNATLCGVKPSDSRFDEGVMYKDRANLSTLPAIKYISSYLWHPEIIWVPISMEEILRIAAIMKLPGDGGDTIFSKSDLGITGVASDDILFIGIEKSHDTQPIKVHLYPVEIKVGRVSNGDLLDKGKVQIYNIYYNYNKYLYPNEKDTFRKVFYRNFFMQQLQASVAKLYLSGLFNDEDFKYISSIRKELENDDFELSYSTQKNIGIGAVILFDTDLEYTHTKYVEAESYTNEQNEDCKILVFHLNQDDLFEGIGKKLTELREDIQTGVSLSPGYLLSKHYASN